MRQIVNPKSLPATPARMLTYPPPLNLRTAEVYSGFSWSKDCMATSNRVDAVLLVRLRAGHTPLLKTYANLLDPSADPLCPLCKEEPQTIEHWLWRFPRLDATRQNIFGSPSPPLKVLTTDPERVLALARVTLEKTFGAEASTTTTPAFITTLSRNSSESHWTGW